MKKLLYLCLAILIACFAIEGFAQKVPIKQILRKNSVCIKNHSVKAKSHVTTVHTKIPKSVVKSGCKAPLITENDVKIKALIHNIKAIPQFVAKNHQQQLKKLEALPVNLKDFFDITTGRANMGGENQYCHHSSYRWQYYSSSYDQWEPNKKATTPLGKRLLKSVKKLLDGPGPDDYSLNDSIRHRNTSLLKLNNYTISNDPINCTSH